MVRVGRLEFYNLKAVEDVERGNCVLGVRKGDKIDPEPLEGAEVLLVEAPKLISGLKAYGDSLAAIADSEDRDDLVTSAGEAKLALSGLAARVDTLRGSEDQALETDVGLVGDLVGTALIAGLNYRRYKTLQKVTATANATVQQAAMVLSQVSMPMVTIELQDAGEEYLDKVAQTNDRQGPAWRAAYAQARHARDTYLEMFAVSPTPVFESMARAHNELVQALRDPKRHQDALQKSLKDFVSKANAAYETFTQ
jgi:hypothetical protein